MKIAVAGKGGTGKTTFAGFLIDYLVEKRRTPVLAIDCDPNTNLHEVLGVQIKDTVGNIRESAVKEMMPSGMARQDFIEYKIQSSLVEAEGFDLIAMGVPEGPGCYCFPNSVIRDCIERLSGQYRYVVIDNEAGMEHLSRRTAGDCDILFIISDPSFRGVETAIKIRDIGESLNISFNKIFLVINRSEEGLNKKTEEIIEREKIDLLGMIPEDRRLKEADEDGIPIATIDSLAKRKFKELMEKIGL